MTEHVLTVYDDGPDVGRSYFIEHPESCPYEHDDAFVIGGRYYTCQVGDIWGSIGEDALQPDAPTLAPGSYHVQAVVHHSPSLPTNGGEEWDAWLEVTPA